jgi:hypothetical protein
MTSPFDELSDFRSIAVDRTSIGLEIAKIGTIEVADGHYKLMAYMKECLMTPL